MCTSALHSRNVYWTFKCSSPNLQVLLLLREMLLSQNMCCYLRSSNRVRAFLSGTSQGSSTDVLLTKHASPVRYLHVRCACYYYSPLQGDRRLIRKMAFTKALFGSGSCIVKAGRLPRKWVGKNIPGDGMYFVREMPTQFLAGEMC